MAAATVYNPQFFDTTTGHPLYSSGHPRRNPGGLNMVNFSVTIAETSEDDAGDRVVLVPLPNGAKDVTLFWQSADLDTASSLDADLVIRADSTDTIIFNGGAAFQSAIGLTRTYAAGPFEEADGLDLSIDFLVNTAAGTDLEGVIQGTVFYRT